MLYKCSCGVYGHSSKLIKRCPSCKNEIIERKDITMTKYYTLSEAIAEIEKDNTKAFISEPIQTGSAVQGKTVIMEIKQGKSIKFRFPEGSTNLNDEQKTISLNRKWLLYDKNKKEIPATYENALNEIKEIRERDNGKEVMFLYNNEYPNGQWFIKL